MGTDRTFIPDCPLFGEGVAGNRPIKRFGELAVLRVFPSYEDVPVLPSTEMRGATRMSQRRTS
jgi:hypothetical protein